VTKHNQHKRIGAGRDAAAAIGNHVRFAESANRYKFGPQIGYRQEGTAFGVEQRGYRHIEAFRNPARPTISVSAGPGELFRLLRLDLPGPRIADGADPSLLAHHQHPIFAQHEFRDWPRPRWSGFDRAPFARPFLETAVQYRGIVEAVIP